VQDKLLRLNSAVLGNLSTGRIVNLVSNDVRRFDDFGPFWVFTWAGPVETVIVLALISIELGAVPAICGVASLLLLVPLQAMLASKIAGLRSQSAAYTDERVRITGEPAFMSFVVFIAPAVGGRSTSVSTCRILHPENTPNK
jgi:ABC-type transport system involved in cytochrome bd biosynthesis fused ATPase/permease subunit